MAYLKGTIKPDFSQYESQSKYESQYKPVRTKPVRTKYKPDLKLKFAPKPIYYKKGGKVKKTGLAIVHKGERVLNKKQAKKYKILKDQ